MSRNTNNSKNRALYNNITNSNNSNNPSDGEDVHEGNTDTLPQPAPALNIQGTADTDEGHVSRREFRREFNDFRDEMRNNHLELKAELKDAIAASIASAMAQVSRSNDDLARRVDALRNDHNQLRADVTGFMNNPTVGITASNSRNTNTQSLGISRVESGNHDNIGDAYGNGNPTVTANDNMNTNNGFRRLLHGGINMLPTGTDRGDAVSEMGSPSAIMQQGPPMEVASVAPSNLDLISLPPVLSVIQHQFQQSDVLQILENESRNVPTTADSRFFADLKRECRSVGNMVCSVRWLRVPSTIVSDARVFLKQPESIQSTKANAVEVTVTEGELLATYPSYDPKASDDRSHYSTGEIHRQSSRVSQVSFVFTLEREVDVPPLPLVSLTYVRPAVAAHKFNPVFFLTLMSANGACKCKCKFSMNGRDVGEASIIEQVSPDTIDLSDADFNSITQNSVRTHSSTLRVNASIARFIEPQAVSMIENTGYSTVQEMLSNHATI